MPRNIIDITDLTVEEIDQLIATAEDIIANPAKYQSACAHKQLATLFFEPSTRTRLSFESAMLALGAEKPIIRRVKSDTLQRLAIVFFLLGGISIIVKSPLTRT